jgi:aldose 1-epimerase
MIRPFGALPDGQVVHAIMLGTPDILQAEILTYGGILRRLILPVRGAPRDLVLTLPDLATYVADRAYLGALVGRCANRIANARFDLSHRQHRLTANEGRNHLHGGALGFGKRLWRLLDLQQAPCSQLRLGLVSPAGEEGYPGTLEVTAEFTVGPNDLRLRFHARADEATPINFTFHPYFNLAAQPGRAVIEQTLRIAASHYLPVVDSGLIPTGEVASVAGTPFDFRIARPLQPPQTTRHPQLEKGGGYDHCWVLDPHRDCDAELLCAHSGIRMQLKSERCGLQFYGGQYLSRTHPGLHGLCLEPQDFPNSVNQPAFPSVILPPGAQHSSTMQYLFTSA